MTDSRASGARDRELPARLLAAERDALIPLLRSRPDRDFGLPTCCPGWTVRHVLAHSAAALTRVVEKRFEPGVFSPESNDRDIAEREGWTIGEVIDELERGMTEAGPVISESAGGLDGIAFGEWVHAGDVREALGEPGAYAGEALSDALCLLAYLTRAAGHVPLLADLSEGPDPLGFGGSLTGRPLARYTGDAPTLVRLYAGRPVAGREFKLEGATEEELNIFG